jgi:hypothetical protein
LIEYNQQLNSLANVRDWLVIYATNLAILDSNSITLQSTSLAQLTEATNQLTRTTLTMVSDKCYQLSLALYSMANEISYEDVQIAATQLIQCAANILNVRKFKLIIEKNLRDI